MTVDAARTERIDRPAASSAPLAGFFEYLKLRGFDVGLGDYARLTALVERLDRDCAPERLKTLIAPVFATSANQQALFYRCFDEYFPLFVADRESVAESRAVDAKEEISPSRDRPRERAPRKRTSRIVASAIIFAGFLGWLAWLGKERFVKQPTPSSPPVASAPAPLQPTAQTPSGTAGAPPRAPEANTPGNPPAVFSPRAWVQAHSVSARVVALVAIGVALMLLEYRAYRRRRLVLERQRRAKPPLTWHLRAPAVQNPFWNRIEVALGARALRRRQLGDAMVLDLERTIAATTESLGFPTFRYARQTRPPEYLVLIDRSSQRDHQAQLFRELVTSLEREGVHLTCFYFDGDPRACYAESGAGHLLDELRQVHASHRLLVFGNGDGFTDPITGRVPAWVSRALSWTDRALLTPEPPTAWGAREVALASHFLVLPATAAAMSALAETHDATLDLRRKTGRRDTSRVTPRLDRPEAIADLRAYLGDAALQWLAACAVYPELQWDLTLAMGSMAELGGGLVNENNLIKLARLTWFRAGTIPESSRSELLRVLNPAVERAARRLIVELLESSRPPATSVAAYRHELDLVVQRIALGWGERRRLRAIARSVEGLPRADLRREFTLLRLAEGRRSSIETTLPDRLKRVFFHHGVPSLGLTSVARFGAAAGAAAVVMGVTQPLAPPSDTREPVAVSVVAPPTIAESVIVPDTSRRAAKSPTPSIAALPQGQVELASKADSFFKNLRRLRFDSIAAARLAWEDSARAAIAARNMRSSSFTVSTFESDPRISFNGREAAVSNGRAHTLADSGATLRVRVQVDSCETWDSTFVVQPSRVSLGGRGVTMDVVIEVRPSCPVRDAGRAAEATRLMSVLLTRLRSRTERDSAISMMTFLGSSIEAQFERDAFRQFLASSNLSVGDPVRAYANIFNVNFGWTTPVGIRRQRELQFVAHPEGAPDQGRSAYVLLATRFLPAGTVPADPSRDSAIQAANASGTPSLLVANKIAQAVNVYINVDGVDTFIRQVAAGASVTIPIRGFASGATVTLKAITVDGARTYSRANVVLSGTTLFPLP